PIPPHKRLSDYGVPPRYLLRGPTIWTILSITMQCKSLIAALLALSIMFVSAAPLPDLPGGVDADVEERGGCGTRVTTCY
ncbi:hypothetical protein F5146DRAFT_171686, partial [Armillaria mellea]